MVHRQDMRTAGLQVTRVISWNEEKLFVSQSIFALTCHRAVLLYECKHTDNNDLSALSEGIKLTRDNKQGCIAVKELGVYKSLNHA